MEPKQHHVVCFPAPAQGHINPMTNLAKLLHSKGFLITFVHTEFNFDQQAISRGQDSPFIHGINGFYFETIPDGLPKDNKRGAKEHPDLCRAMASGEEPKNALRSLLRKLLASSDKPPITSVILDAQLNFAFEVVKEFDIRVFPFHTASACAVLGYLHYNELVNKGLFPLSGKNVNNGILDTPVDWIPGLFKGAKLKHLPSFIRSDEDEMMFINYNIVSAENAVDSRTLILNTFDDLEYNALQQIKSKIPNLVTIGPLPLLCDQQPQIQQFRSNLFTEDSNCLNWLDQRSPKSVIYVNYGSLATLTYDQLTEFAWGLANSNQYFLWIIREDLVNGETRVLSKEFMDEIKERGMIARWCRQETVVKHPSIAVFLTHCGWNSTLESVGEGIPVICWPFFADQSTNCAYAFEEWGIGMEIGDEDGDVKRTRVEIVVREMMEGEIGEKIRVRALELKNMARIATRFGGSSCNSFEELVKWLTLGVSCD
ncbi:7-deoxyloganetin glucosyltransferase-like [Silene latifolia]|uniref:7-deoxyloganetin glucosyltransferase-like n=1 Tax=Silene latifolia TaxID=37657 RepID=UPI003D77880A